MKKSEWITIISIVGGIFLTSISSTAVLFFKIGSVAEKVTTLEKNFEKFDGRMGKMESDIYEIKAKLDILTSKVDILWRDRFELNTAIKQVPIDKKALDKTKVGVFINEHYQEILKQVKSIKPDNSRQAEAALISVVVDFGKNHDEAHKLNVAAFESGYDLDSLLIMASMTIRARVIADLSL